MLPREFEREFGRPTLAKLIVNVGQTVVIPPDPDRYLIVFVQTTGSCVLHYGEDRELQFGGTALPTASMPLKFSHAIDGSLVGMAFTVEGVDPLSVLTYLVGRMAPRRRVTLPMVRLHGTKTYPRIESDRDRGRSDRTRA